MNETGTRPLGMQPDGREIMKQLKMVCIRQSTARGNYYVQDLEKNRKITEWAGYKKERDQVKKTNTNREGPRLANNTAWNGHNPTSPWNINPGYSYFGYNLFY